MENQAIFPGGYGRIEIIQHGWLLPNWGKGDKLLNWIMKFTLNLTNPNDENMLWVISNPKATWYYKLTRSIGLH